MQTAEFYHVRRVFSLQGGKTVLFGLLKLLSGTGKTAAEDIFQFIQSR